MAEQPSSPQPSTKVHKPKNESPLEISAESFDQTTFQNALEEYLEEFKSKISIQDAMALKQPFELKGEKAVFFLVSDLQTEPFQKIRPALLNHLRRKLNNHRLQVESEVREEIKDDRKRLYTSTDKLHYLREKSDLLGELLNRFKLETDF